MPSTWSLRPATEADLPFLVALRLATMAPQFARQGLVLSDEEHRLRAEFRLDAARIVEAEGRAIGLVKLLQDGATWTLEQFQIAPEAQGRGIGAAVLGQIIAASRESGALLRLSVLKCNPAARLYARLGFRTLAESEHSYKMTFIDA
ncbi:MAG: GNAT family N-acetyltransferase [Betaproteobacteria bacterium]